MGFLKEMPFKIIYEDTAILVCFKAAGLAVQTSGLGSKDLVSLLKNYLASGREKNKNPYLGVIHRLDQPVSGLLVFAKDKKPAADLSRQIQNGLANKDYLALCEGNMEEPSGTLISYLRKNPQTKLAEAVSEEVWQRQQKEAGSCGKTKNKKEDEYKKAVLTYEVIKEYGNTTLLKIHLETGRFHQIRAQFAFVGHPLLGDMKYGTPSSKEISLKKAIKSTALCANRLAFKHPSTGKEMVFELEKAELPSWI